MLEVEQKFALVEVAPLVERLRRLGGEPGAASEQVDEYFAHPVRDFAVTDEALRIRRVGEINLVTYKGPKLDATTKTRREIELPLAPGAGLATDYAELLAVLGFRRVLTVSKQRRTAHVVWQGRDFEVALDQVAGLGSFIELETQADERQLDAARGALASLAAELGLEASERRSYLELLLAAKPVK